MPKLRVPPPAQWHHGPVSAERTIFIPVLTLMALFWAPLAQARALFIGSVEPSTYVTEEEALALTRLTQAETRKALEGIRVITPTSMESTASLAEINTCVESGDAACLSGFSTMNGVTHLMIPAVADVGSELVYSIGIYDARSGALVAQATRRASAHAFSGLLDAIPGQVVEVLGDADFEVRAEAMDAARSPWPWVILGAGVGVGLVAAAGGVGLHFFSLDLAQRYEEARLSADEARNWEQSGGLVLAAPYVLYAAAALLITGGIIGAVVAE
jgi:hypothetical protein